MTVLRAQHPNLPAIALSGYGRDEDLVRGREAGFSAYLTKPVEFRQLEEAIERATRRSA